MWALFLCFVYIVLYTICIVCIAGQALWKVIWHQPGTWKESLVAEVGRVERYSRWKKQLRLMYKNRAAAVERPALDAGKEVG